MTEEFSLSSSLLFSRIFDFCFFILSHPLYFSYFIFFFPYLLRLISFLSPLFATTFLLLLAFFSVSPARAHGGVVDQNRDGEGSPGESKMGLLDTSEPAIFDHEKEEFFHSEELEWYETVFETCRFFEAREIAPVEVLEVQVEIDCSSHASETVIFVDKNPSNGEEEDSKPDQNQPELEMEREEKERENTASYMKKTPEEVETDREDDEEITKQMESDAETIDIEMVSNHEREKDSSKVEEKDSEAVEMKITSLASTRKETAWRNSLACKLFEERYNVEAGNEEMDLLWETYETKESKGKAEDHKSSSKKKDLRSWVNQKETEDEEEEEEEGKEEGKICCLQALKFSTGKMRFGMGKRSSLMKITKAFKGFKLLHELTKNGKNKNQKTHS